MNVENLSRIVSFKKALEDIRVKAQDLIRDPVCSWERESLVGAPTPERCIYTLVSGRFNGNIHMTVFYWSHERVDCNVWNPDLLDLAEEELQSWAKNFGAEVETDIYEGS